MVNVCLIYPPKEVGITSPSHESPYPPLGLLYLAACLEKEGHKVSIIDCAIEDLTHEGLKNRLRKIKPDVVGISILFGVNW